MSRAPVTRWRRLRSFSNASEASPKRLQRFGGVSEAFPPLRRRLRSGCNRPKAPGRIPSENASQIRQIKTGQTHSTKGRIAGSKGWFDLTAQVAREPNNVSCPGQAVEASPNGFQQGFFSPSNHTGQIFAKAVEAFPKRFQLVKRAQQKVESWVKGPVLFYFHRRPGGQKWPENASRIVV